MEWNNIRKYDQRAGKDTRTPKTCDCTSDDEADTGRSRTTDQGTQLEDPNRTYEDPFL